MRDHLRLQIQIRVLQAEVLLALSTTQALDSIIRDHKLTQMGIHSDAEAFVTD